jgi:hypothetical protein
MSAVAGLLQLRHMLVSKLLKATIPPGASLAARPDIGRAAYSAARHVAAATTLRQLTRDDTEPTRAHLGWGG